MGVSTGAHEHLGPDAPGVGPLGVAQTHRQPMRRTTTRQVHHDDATDLALHQIGPPVLVQVGGDHAAHVLRVGGLQPSHYVGAEIPLLGTNAHWDHEGEYLVAEGDESDGSLVNFHPAITLLLNVEEEHLDHYSGLNEIMAVFRQCLRQTSGFVVYCGDDTNARIVGAELGERGLSYGTDRDCDYAAGVVSSDGQSSQFSVFHRGELLGRVELNIPGQHNVLNAMGVIAIAIELGVDFQSITQALSTFRGARRRFDRKYTSPHYHIVDDYGHHPTF